MYWAFERTSACIFISKEKQSRQSQDSSFMHILHSVKRKRCIAISIQVYINIQLKLLTTAKQSKEPNIMKR